MEIQIFEARELRPYSEPLKASNLEEGGVYFVFGFLDADMVVPELRPVVFVGRNLKGEGEEKNLYFQDFASYQEGIRYATTDDESEAQFEICEEGDLGFVYGFEQALNEILSCSLRRRTKR